MTFDTTPSVRFEFALKEAPLLNVYSRMHWGKRHALGDVLSWRVAIARCACPKWHFEHGNRRRLVRLTRYSSKRPDELAIDIIGGKAIMDQLVKAGVLRDDSHDWCERDARWEKAGPKMGRVVVEVFDERGTE